MPQVVAAHQYHEAAKVRHVKRGEYVRLKVNGPVWIRGDYCRESQAYELQSFDDANRTTYRKANATVYHGFTF